MKAKLLIIVALVSLALGGCSTVTKFDPTTDGKPTTGTDLSPIQEINAGALLRDRNESIKNLGTLVFPTGKVFANVFTGTATSRGTIELITADLQEISSESWVISETKLVYTVSVALDLDGRRHLLTATGTGSTHLSYPNAMREAAEKTVSHLAAQVRALL